MQRRSNGIKSSVSRHRDGDLPVRVLLSKSLTEQLCKISGKTRLSHKAITLEAIRRGVNFLQSA